MRTRWVAVVTVVGALAVPPEGHAGGPPLPLTPGGFPVDSADLFDLRAGLRSDAVYYDAQRAPGEAAFYGVAFAPDGATAWVAGGGQDVVHVLSVSRDSLRQSADVPAGTWPAGL